MSSDLARTKFTCRRGSTRLSLEHLVEIAEGRTNLRSDCIHDGVPLFRWPIESVSSSKSPSGGNALRGFVPRFGRTVAHAPQQERQCQCIGPICDAADGCELNIDAPVNSQLRQED